MLNVIIVPVNKSVCIHSIIWLQQERQPVAFTFMMSEQIMRKTGKISGQHWCQRRKERIGEPKNEMER
jgi:hypothetical protein